MELDDDLALKYRVIEHLPEFLLKITNLIAVPLLPIELVTDKPVLLFVFAMLISSAKLNERIPERTVLHCHNEAEYISVTLASVTFITVLKDLHTRMTFMMYRTTTHIAASLYSVHCQNIPHARALLYLFRCHTATSNKEI
jgi:hypothetical protein